jgi:hypothetical protein
MKSEFAMRPTGLMKNLPGCQQNCIYDCTAFIENVFLKRKSATKEGSAHEMPDTADPQERELGDATAA